MRANLPSEDVVHCDHGGRKKSSIEEDEGEQWILVAQWKNRVKAELLNVLDSSDIEGTCISVLPQFLFRLPSLASVTGRLQYCSHDLKT